MPLSKPSPLLPTELWLEILGHVSSDYYSLRALSRTNRFFLGLTRSAEFDQALFRDAPAPIPRIVRSGTNPSYAMHPLLSCLRNAYVADVRQLRIGRPITTTSTPTAAAKRSTKTFRLIDYRVQHEHASAPAVATLRIRLVGVGSATLQNAAGVTVRQVMAAYCMLMAEPLPLASRQRRAVMRAIGVPASYAMAGDDEHRLTNRDMLRILFDGVFERWEGFEIDQQGVPVLHNCSNYTTGRLGVHPRRTRRTN